MNYKFFLDDIQIEEPIGWADFELSMKRDEVYHGMQFEASTGSLQFFGNGANYLINKKKQNRINNNVVFKAQSTCDTIYETIISGRLNFGKYKDSCSVNGCFVTMPFEEDSCKVVFNNRFDQNVDLDKLFGFDNSTVLPAYAQLGKLIRMPAKALQAAVDGSVSVDGYENIAEFDGTSTGLLLVRPEYEIERYNNIKTGQLTGGNNCESNSGSSCIGPITPQILFEDDIDCFDGNYNYTVTMKGSVTLTAGINLFHIKHKIVKWDAVGDIFNDGVIVQEIILFDGAPTPPPGPLTQAFENTFTGTTTLADGIGFYSFIEVGYTTSGADRSITILFDKETLFTLQAVRICPDTQSQYYMVHEALSRVVESITNKCIRLKSSYYGRTDSQPFAFDEDGCGALRFLTSGLKIRNAPEGKFFASAKTLIAGLNSIDNIGFDVIDDDTIPNRSILRLEGIDFFYKDEEILSLKNVPVASNEIQEAMHFAKINVGYKKWEVEGVNGLNEFNSNREYRTNVETINNVLDITSSLIAGSYPIEVTRLQNFAETGAADTTYDNDIFIICVQRNAYDFSVEQNKILNPDNIFDPDTVLNFRISPIRNLMRWFKNIINTYPSINGSAYRLFFNSGTANFLAYGQLDDATSCRLENSAIRENDTISVLNFTDQSNATPLYQNETSTFDYPLSIKEYNGLKQNPYGYISYTCGGNNIINKGFIREIKFKPSRGIANFTLIKKWS